jgi:hypothetical protein
VAHKTQQEIQAHMAKTFFALCNSEVSYLYCITLKLSPQISATSNLKVALNVKIYPITFCVVTLIE